MLMSFARWLRAQTAREDWIGELARAAERDWRFPWNREPLDMDERVKEWLRAGAPNGDAAQAFQAALDEWHGGPYNLAADAIRRREEEMERMRQKMEPVMRHDEALRRRREAARRKRAG